MTCQVLIPCKPLDEGKSRLSAILSDMERRDLCERLLDNTLRLAKRMARPEDVFLVTRDRLAVAKGQAAGASVIDDRVGTLNGALSQARDQVRDTRRSLLILPIDLVAANEVAIGNTLGIADVAIAGDRAGAGTNLLALGPAVRNQFVFQFGTNSFRRHIAWSDVNGFSVRALDDERLRFDLDEPSDYAAAKRSLSTGELVS